jgi:hypothetical protein
LSHLQFVEPKFQNDCEQTMTPTPTRNPHNRWTFIKAQDSEFNGAKLIRYRYEQTTKKYLTHIRFAAKQVLFLSTYAEEENWGEKQRVLRSYLNSTFQRLVEEGKVLVYRTDKLGNTSGDTIAMVWNTGLLTISTVQEIYCVMIRNNVFTNKLGKSTETDETGIADWRIATFLCEEKFLDLKTFRFMINNWSTVEIKMTDMPDRVPLASYFSTSDPLARFIYDSQIPLKKTAINVRHLLHHKERLPEDFCNLDNDRLVECVQNGIDISLRRARHNYRLAIPQFFRDKYNNGEGVIQLLLPIKLHYGNRELEIAVALQLEIVDSESTDVQRHYVVKTLFTLDMAYSNARLLQKVDQSWLYFGVENGKVKRKDEQYPQPYYVPYYVPYPMYYPPNYKGTNAEETSQ